MLRANVPYLTKDKKHKDFRKYGMVVHSSKMLGNIQASLLKQGTVIQFQRGEKTIIRNNIKWTDAEIMQLKQMHSNNISIKKIAKALGRSKESAYQKLRNTEIKEGVWVWSNV